MTSNNPHPDSEVRPEANPLSLTVRSAFAGVLMGLANLVPGISGGTMLLAAGVYPRFIGAIGELTRFRFRFHSILVLATVVASALIAIVLGAGLIKDLVIDHRWVMYALFIGLTLGGVPVVWRLIDRKTGAMLAAALLGFIAMAALALAQQAGVSGSSSGQSSWLMMAIAGVAGASAMILPGVSGGYLFLVLGVYIPILSAVDRLKSAILDDFNLAVVFEIGLTVILPVGLGVVVGVVVVSNILKIALDKAPRPTLGLLLGLLLGAVIGLYPFQEAVPPEAGDVIKGRTVASLPDGSLVLTSLDAELEAEPLEKDDYPTQWFTPSAIVVFAAIGLVVVGFGATLVIDRISKEKPNAKPSA